MTLWQRLFGPSTTDQLLALLVQQQTAQATLMQTWAETLKAQQDVAQRQMDLMTAPQEPPKVRIMTRATEAQYEQQRSTPKEMRTVAPEQFMDDMTDFFQQVKRES